MKRLFVVACVTVLVGLAGSAGAQVQEHTSMVLTTIGYTYAQTENYDQDLKGAGFSIVWEQVTWDRQMSIGFGGGYSSSWFDRASDNFSFSRLPFYATFKGLFGPPEYTGYLGVGIGATIDRIEVTGDDGIEERRTEAPFSFIVPLGIYLAPNPKVGFNFNVTYQFSNTDLLKNNSMLIFGFGVMFLM